MKKKKKQTRVQEELSALLVPYAKHWETWTKTLHCFLSEREVQIVELIKEHGSIAVAAQWLQSPSHQISREYKTIKLRLRSYHRVYKKWEYEIPIEPETRKRSPRIMAKAEFLNASFHSRYYSRRIGKRLAVMGDNMFEVLTRYNAKQLKRLRYFGKLHFTEFKNILKENHCLDLLSED